MNHNSIAKTPQQSHILPTQEENFTTIVVSSDKRLILMSSIRLNIIASEYQVVCYRINPSSLDQAIVGIPHCKSMAESQILWI